MANVDFNVDIDDDLDCDCEDDLCCDEGCVARLMVGPCDFINAAGVPDLSNFCVPATQTDFNITWTRPVRTKEYRRNCHVTKLRGKLQWSLSVTFDICQTDEGICRLMSDCKFGIALIPRADLWDNSKPYNEQSTGIMYGVALGSDLDWAFPFDECQNTSVTYEGDKKLYRHNLWQGLYANNSISPASIQADLNKKSAA